MVGRIRELKIPGSLLEVKPIEDRDAPIIVRIVRTFPHGSDFRYEIEYYGLEPGTYDLGDFLRRADGSSDPLTVSLPVQIVSVLPDGQVKPHALDARPPPRLGGYQQLLIAGGVLWTIGLLVILFWGRGSKHASGRDPKKPRSLAERLRPLVDRAVAGDASHSELASLERSLLTYWRKRLNLQDQASSEAMRELRAHPEAGGLMTQLEQWLHNPEVQSEIDVEALLAPYRNVSERELESSD